MFQFHKGTSKTPSQSAETQAAVTFQFHKGTSKTQQELIR